MTGFRWLIATSQTTMSCCLARMDTDALRVVALDLFREHVITLLFDISQAQLNGNHPQIHVQKKAMQASWKFAEDRKLLVSS